MGEGILYVYIKPNKINVYTLRFEVILSDLKELCVLFVHICTRIFIIIYMQRLDYISIARLRGNVADYGACIWND